MMQTGGPARQQTVRNHNLRLVLACLSEAAGSRAELASRSGLTKGTVASLVDALLREGILAEAAPEISGPGRPSRSISFAPDGPAAIGVEINVDYLGVCVLDLTGALRSTSRIPMDNRAGSAEQVLRAAADLVRPVVRSMARPALGIALAVPGVVSPDGEVLRAPNLPLLTGIRAGERLARLLALPADERVAVENEANLGALARLLSMPADGSDFVYVSGEVGVGAGLVVGGELFRGVNGYGGELGHVVVDRDGPACACGGSGCVEQYAGQEVLLRGARQPDVAALLAAARGGDERATGVLAEAGRALGVGLASLLNVIDVPSVVLGGLYAELFDEITPALQAELRRRVLSSAHGGGQVRRSSLGKEAAVRGAAALVIDRVLKDPVLLSGSVAS